VHTSFAFVPAVRTLFRSLRQYFHFSSPNVFPFPFFPFCFLHAFADPKGEPELCRANIPGRLTIRIELPKEITPWRVKLAPTYAYTLLSRSLFYHHFSTTTASSDGFVWVTLGLGVNPGRRLFRFNDTLVR
jgi:hypothetical protein